MTVEDKAKAVGKAIRKERKSRYVRQGEMAKEIGATSAAISRWENGKCFPNLYYVIRVCEYLGCRIEDLLRGIVEYD